MDTIKDYILWRGDLSFKQSAFNTLDAIVLTQISYFNMSPYFKNHKRGTISEIYRYLSTHDAIECTLVGPPARSIKLFTAAAASERFRHIRISKYIDIHDTEHPLQFAAANFIFDGITFVAFRGTDGSVSGWKEDFMITFKRTEAQKLAADYLSASVNELGSNRLFAAGHSKGANLAMYASAKLPANLQEKIEKIYVFDGPGFCPDVLNTKALSMLDAKMEMVIPEYCVFGKLFNPNISNTTIVKSIELGIAQHDMSSWRVQHTSLYPAEANAVTSELIVHRLMKLVDEMDLDQREKFVDHLFTLISEDGENEKWGLNLPHPPKII